MAAIRKRGRNFVAEVVLRPNFQKLKPSSEEVDFFMRVLGLLLSDLRGMQEETTIPAPKETAGNAEKTATNESDQDATEHPVPRSRGYTPGTQ